MLKDNLSVIRSRIEHAAMGAGRKPGEITLVAVTKTVALDKIKEAIEIGMDIFGENRVQEAQNKISNLKNQATRPVAWHLIGHLQKNKVKYAVALFELIHTVDSVALADEINRQAEKMHKIQRILAQVKLAEEDTKHGISENGLPLLVDAITGMKHLSLEGLMTIPPFFENPEMARPYFRRLRTLRDKYIDSGYRLKELSMGMSNDFEAAIQEGATLVRIGTAIFGERSI